MNAAIRILTRDAHADIVRHLTYLSSEDRVARFGVALDDEALGRYVSDINFARDTLFGVFEEGDALVGVMHLRLDWRRDAAWAGMSVEPASRCRGYGYALLCLAALEARRSGCSRLALPGLAENHIMKHLARKAGLSVIDELGRPSAYLALGDPAVERRTPFVPQRSLGGRRLRTLIVGALLPIFGFEMAAMIAVGAACDSCRPQTVTISP